MRKFDRLRTFLAAGLLAGGCAGMDGNASAADARRHAMSLVNAPIHGPDYKNFDWVNPNAPKGGRFRQF